MSETAAAGIPLATLERRERSWLLVTIGVLAALSWVALALERSVHGDMLHAARDPHIAESGLRAFGLAWGMWLAMIAAMMLPIVTPWILLFGGMTRRRDPDTSWTFSTSWFVLGYVAVWSLYSLGAAVTQVGLQRTALLHGADLRVNSVIGGGLLLLAGVFQFTGLKQACLRHCRTPLGFFLSRWRDGPLGGFRLGVTHGAYCVACCWALMALSFVLGVMNLLWMAALTLMMGAEKLLPRGEKLSRGFGLIFLGWAAWLVVGAF